MDRKSLTALGEKLDSPSGQTTRLVLGECRDVMREMDERCLPHPLAGPFDLVFADPPYNLKVDYGEGVRDDLTPGEYERFTLEWMQGAYQLMSPQGSMWVVISEHHLDAVMLAAREIGLHTRRHIIWYFRFAQNLPGNFGVSHAYIMYYCKSPTERIFNGDLILEPSDRAVKYKDQRTHKKKSASTRGGLRLPLDVWEIPRIQGNNKERRPQHENQIPEEILWRVLRVATNERSRVLDPFGGSGTTSTVARKMGLSSVSIELNEPSLVSSLERVEMGPVREPQIWNPASLADAVKAGAFHKLETEENDDG